MKTHSISRVIPFLSACWKEKKDTFTHIKNTFGLLDRNNRNVSAVALTEQTKTCDVTCYPVSLQFFHQSNVAHFTSILINVWHSCLYTFSDLVSAITIGQHLRILGSQWLLFLSKDQVNFFRVEVCGHAGQLDTIWRLGPLCKKMNHWWTSGTKTFKTLFSLKYKILFLEIHC